MQRKTIVALSSIGINVVMLFFCTYFYFEHGSSIAQKTTTIQAKEGKPFSVAIFEPALHPAIEEITQGFKQTLEQQGSYPYEYTIFNANANKTLQRSQAEQIIHNNYDLIFTIGMSCTAMIKELSTKKTSNTPVVFSAISDPIGNGIVESLEHSHNNFTGVIDKQDYQKQLEVLSVLKPSTRSVLLVYDPSHPALEEEKNSIVSLASSRGISCKALPIYNAGELQQKVESSITGNDVVLVLKDNTIVSGIDSLIRLCNRYGVTLYASDLNSGQKGAALAYGVHEKDYGVQAAHKALRILEQHEKPTDVPTTPLNHFNITINTSTMNQQQLVINPTMRFLLSQTTFITSQGA